MTIINNTSSEQSLHNEDYFRLDGNCTKDKKNRLRKRIDREHARSYVHYLPVDCLEPFDVSDSVLVTDIQTRRAGPEYYARVVKEGLEQENGLEIFY
jgi:hypothetical protein